MAREREKFAERTESQPRAGGRSRMSFPDTTVAKPSTASHPALMALVKILARQAVRDELTRQTTRDIDRIK